MVLGSFLGINQTHQRRWCATLVVMNTQTTLHNQNHSVPPSLRLPANRSSIGWVLGICSLCLMLGGCSKALSPTFTAVGVREVERNNDRSVIEFVIEAKNPNREPIPLKEIQYAVSIDGQEVFTGLRSPEVSLHTYATQTFTLPAVLPMDVVGAVGSAGEIQYRINGSVEYIPPGRLAEVLFDAKLKVPMAPIDLSGTINLGNDLSNDE